MYETPITGRLSVLVDQLFPPSVDFHSPPPGEPTQIIFLSNGSNAMQLILPLPLFLPFERIIGVLTGPSSIQLLFDVDFKLFIFSFSFNHSLYNCSFGIPSPFDERFKIKSRFLAYGLYPFPFVYSTFFL